MSEPNCSSIPFNLLAFSPAIKEKSKGRASVGLAIFTNNLLKNSLTILDITQHWIICKINYNNYKIYLIFIYFKPSCEISMVLELLQTVLNNIRIQAEDTMFVGGDTNCRVGIQEQLPDNLDAFNLNIYQDSYAIHLNTRGRALHEFMIANNCFLVNGRTLQ